MISRRQLPELRIYAENEALLPFLAAPELGALVVPNGNEDRPLFSWFKYKEAFSADLLRNVIDRLDLAGPSGSRLRLLDPYCGVGTALLSAQLLDSGTCGIHAIGIECNPFSAFVARTKLAWPHTDAARLRQHAADILSQLPSMKTRPLPALSSVKSGRCISRYAANQVLAVRDLIHAIPSSAERDVLLVGLAACIERVSRVRRDGRALRLVEKRRTSLRRILAERWARMIYDIESLQRAARNPGHCEVRLGDGRRPTSLGIEDGSIDLILTSPPYPNNIDYNEVYKLELWLMGFVETEEAFYGLRRHTFRSHPTCSPAEDDGEFQAEFARLLTKGPLADLVGMIVRRASALDRLRARGRSKVLLGYFYDTWRSLVAHHRVLRPGSHAVYVVGNSLHGGPEKPYLVPTDLILSCLAELAGFTIDRLLVARQLPRRLSGNHFLRDSLVVLRRD